MLFVLWAKKNILFMEFCQKIRLMLESLQRNNLRQLIPSKFVAYCKVMEEGSREKKNERPTGSKRAKQEEKDGKVIEKALKEAGCHKDGAKGVPVQSFGGYDKMVGVLEQLLAPL
jgi:hypothetical protein